MGSDMRTSIVTAQPARVRWKNGLIQPRLAILMISGSLLGVCGFVALPAVLTDTSRWPATEGVLVQVVRTGGDIRGKARIRYTYEVDGRTYSGRRFALWRDSLPIPVLLQSKGDWSPGARLRVYHHPTRPEQAVLDPYVSPALKAGVIFGTVLCLAGVVGALLPGSRSL